ncbi:hypothetical protein [Nocardiopsis sp. CC223A]|uniref:hypothetical protein n=1 Tax=Nocardiopsis sp. CC223A TaxID=3044051 RepID=UPI00278C3BAC|nr:hypothetical protein [Nocardiopsis sp. CC223A]
MRDERRLDLTRPRPLGHDGDRVAVERHAPRHRNVPASAGDAAARFPARHLNGER